MEIKKEKTITETKFVVVGHECDVCGKIHEGNNIPNEWHLFNHHHNEWGNDSIESYEYHEVCSPKCYWEKFKECVNLLNGKSDAKIDEFEIQFARKLIDFA
jgi:hypothetical protein